MYPKWYCEPAVKNMGFGIQFTATPYTWVTVEFGPYSFASVGVNSVRDVKWAILRLLEMYF